MTDIILLEKCLNLDMTIEFLHINNIITSQASGLDIPLKLAYLMLPIIQNIDEGMYTGAIFLDLKKAFDTVHHRTLINKLSKCGVNGLELDWFKSYIADRFQICKIEKKQSNMLPISFGVPQGSILGPLLFSLYVNDLPNQVNKNHTKNCLYADDTAIFTRHRDPSQVATVLTNEMEKVSHHNGFKEINLPNNPISRCLTVTCIYAGNKRHFVVMSLILIISYNSIN